MNYKDLKVMTIDEAMSNYDDKTEFCLEDEVYEMYQTYEERIKELEANEQILNDAHCKLMDKLEEKDKRIKELETALATSREEHAPNVDEN